MRRGGIGVVVGLLGLPALLAGCAGGGAPDPVGEWAGTLHTEQGRCPDAMPSRLLVGSENISFVPGDGTLVLKGVRHPGDPALHAQLMLRDADHKPLPMVFEGAQAADGKTIQGTYGTPSCRASVTLRRPDAHPLQRLFGG